MSNTKALSLKELNAKYNQYGYSFEVLEGFKRIKFENSVVWVVRSRTYIKEMNAAMVEAEWLEESDLMGAFCPVTFAAVEVLTDKASGTSYSFTDGVLTSMTLDDGNIILDDLDGSDLKCFYHANRLDNVIEWQPVQGCEGGGALQVLKLMSHPSECYKYQPFMKYSESAPCEVEPVMINRVGAFNVSAFWQVLGSIVGEFESFYLKSFVPYWATLAKNLFSNPCQSNQDALQ